MVCQCSDGESYFGSVRTTLFLVYGPASPVFTLSVACAESVLSKEEGGALPDHLEDILTGSHPSLGGGGGGRLSLTGLLHRYAHVFPAPGEPVTGHTTSVQHDILTLDARLVRYMLVVIRTQKDRKLQTLIEVCTDFASPTNVH